MDENAYRAAMIKHYADDLKFRTEDSAARERLQSDATRAQNRMADAYEALNAGARIEDDLKLAAIASQRLTDRTSSTGKADIPRAVQEARDILQEIRRTAQ